MVASFVPDCSFVCGLRLDAFLFWRWFAVYRAMCGHKTAIHAIIRAHSGWTITSLSTRKRPYCHECLQKMAIRCALCGRPIFIGDPISLPSIETRDTHITWFDVTIACCREPCIDTNALVAGRWMPPGLYGESFILFIIAGV